MCIRDRKNCIIIGTLGYNEWIDQMIAKKKLDVEPLKNRWLELAQDWRMDKAMRKLEAMLLCADKENLLLVSGTGEVIEPDDGVLTIGSGGNYALAAARALMQNTDLPARDIAERALKIASDICIFTNGNIIVETV